MIAQLAAKLKFHLCHSNFLRFFPNRPTVIRSIIKLAAIASAIAAPLFATNLTLNQLNSAWELLTFAGVISTLSVWYGVSLEAEHNSAGTQHRGARIVVLALLIESWTGWALWQTDDAINDKKDAQIADLREANKRLGHRNFDDAQREIISSTLRASAKGTVYVVPAEFDSSDANDFASMITGLLKAGGFDPAYPTGKFRIASYNEHGIWLVVTDVHHAPPQAFSLEKAFTAAGFALPAINSDPGREFFSQLKPNEVVIAVSSHP